MKAATVTPWKSCTWVLTWEWALVRDTSVIIQCTMSYMNKSCTRSWTMYMLDAVYTHVLLKGTVTYQWEVGSTFALKLPERNKLNNVSSHPLTILVQQGLIISIQDFLYTCSRRSERGGRAEGGRDGDSKGEGDGEGKGDKGSVRESDVCICVWEWEQVSKQE